MGRLRSQDSTLLTKLRGVWNGSSIYSLARRDKDFNWELPPFFEGALPGKKDQKVRN
jgi:hypothetical protein